MKIIIDAKNDLLKRREVKVIIEAEKNPGYTNALRIISEHFKAGENVIVIKNLKSKFGRNTFLIDAFIYDSVKDKDIIELKKKEKKSLTTASVEGGKK